MSDMAVALLRGVNVGGKNILPMKALAEIFARAGCTDVNTYIQSGNVVFRARDPHHVTAVVSKHIASDFGFQSPVVIRSASELRNAIAANPFLKRDIDPSLLHAMFLAAKPTRELLAALDPARSPGDEFAVVGSEIYLHLPNGAAKTKLTNAYFDTKLKTVATQRNWRTVLTLAAMMEAPATS